MKIANVELEDFLAKLKSSEVDTKSKLRNENKQTREGSSRVPFFKKEKGKQCKLLLLTDMALPFNPFTGKADETYNSENKFRPESSFSTTLLALKRYYEKDETGKQVKELIVERFGVPSWDTSKLDEITEEDFKLWRQYRYARISTHNMITIVSPTLHGNTYGANYRVNFERDEYGDVVTADGNYPEILTINQMYMSALLEKYNEWEEENSQLPEKDKKEKKRSILSDLPVSKDQPRNFIFGIDLKLNSNSEVDGIDRLNAEELRNRLVVVQINKKIETAINAVLKTQVKRDIYPDFLEIEVTVPDEENAATRGQNTTYGTPVEALAKMDPEVYTKFYNDVVTMIDSFKRQDVVLTKSAARREIKEDTVDKICEALAIDMPFESIAGYLKEGALERYCTTISAIYGDQADDLLVSLEAGEAEEDSVTDEDIKIANQDISDIMGDDLDEIEDIDD